MRVDPGHGPPEGNSALRRRRGSGELPVRGRRIAEGDAGWQPTMWETDTGNAAGNMETRVPRRSVERRLLPQEHDLLLQQDPELLAHPRLHYLGQLQHLARRGPTSVHDDVGVLGKDHRVADPQAPA